MPKLDVFVNVGPSWHHTPVQLHMSLPASQPLTLLAPANAAQLLKAPRCSSSMARTSASLDAARAGRQQYSQPVVYSPEPLTRGGQQRGAARKGSFGRAGAARKGRTATAAADPLIRLLRDC